MHLFVLSGVKQFVQLSAHSPVGKRAALTSYLGVCVQFTAAAPAPFAFN